MSKFIIFDHAIQDIVGLKPLLTLLLADQRMLIKSEQSHAPIEDQTLHKTLEGVINLLELTFPEDLTYGLTWLYLYPNSVEECFSKEVAEVLQSAIERHGIMTMTTIIDFLNNRKLPITIEGKLPLDPDVIEGIKNATKYAKSWIKIEKTYCSDTVLITNDINPFRKSGTQQGLKHHGIVAEEKEGVFYALISKEGFSQPHILTISEIESIAQKLGWTSELNINNVTFSNKKYERLASMLKGREQVFIFEDEEIKEQAKEMIKTVFSKHLNACKRFFISEGGHHLGINISADFNFYSGTDFYPSW